MLNAELLDKRELTECEAKVLLAVCEGKSDKVIARFLGISARTVAHHLEHVYEKLAVRSLSVNVRCAAIATAIAKGMVRLSIKALAVLLIVQLFELDEDCIRYRPARYGRLVEGRRDV